MGLMSYSERQKALEKLKTKYLQCPNCRGRDAAIDDVVGLPVLERTIPSGIGPGDQVIAAVPVICANCDHITFFGAKQLLDLA